MGTAWAILGVLMVLGLIYRTVRKDAQARFQSKIADNTLKHLKKLNEVDNESDNKLNLVDHPVGTNAFTYPPLHIGQFWHGVLLSYRYGSCATTKP